MHIKFSTSNVEGRVDIMHVLTAYSQDVHSIQQCLLCSVMCICSDAVHRCQKTVMYNCDCTFVLPDTAAALPYLFDPAHLTQVLLLCRLQHIA